MPFYSVLKSLLCIHELRGLFLGPLFLTEDLKTGGIHLYPAYSDQLVNSGSICVTRLEGFISVVPSLVFAKSKPTRNLLVETMRVYVDYV